MMFSRFEYTRDDKSVQRKKKKQNKKRPIVRIVPDYITASYSF